MQDKTLLLIALATGIVGLVALYFILIYAKIPEMTISEMESENPEQKIVLKGTIEKIDAREKVTFITLSQKEFVNAVVFDQILLEKGDYISVSGRWDKSQQKFTIDEIHK